MSGRAGRLFPQRPKASAEQASQLMRQGAILLAAKMLARQGREVASLSGGIHAWARAGLPVVAAGGRPGRVA